MKPTPASQRVDTWLWHARLFKSRTVAGDMVSAGKVRLTRFGVTSKIGKTASPVKPGDELSFYKGRDLKVVKIVSCATRRGPAPEAQALYEDLSPPPISREKRKSAPAQREEGSGRPTKKERRALDEFEKRSREPKT